MNKLRLVSIALLALTLSGCRGLKVDNARIASQDDWVTEGDSPLRQHLTDAELQPPLQERWQYNAGAGFGPGSPLILGNVVLVATRKGELHAINLESGKRVGFDNFGDALEGTPVINDGFLYIPVGWGKRVLYAYDLANARTHWTKRGIPIEAGLLATEQGIVAVDTEGVITVYNPETGDVFWSQSFGESVLVKSTPLLSAGNLVVVDTKGHVLAMHPEDGAIVWTQQLEAPVYSSMSSNEEVLVVPTTRGILYGLDATGGGMRWNVALPDTTVRFSAPATDNETVYVAATDGVFRALDIRTGAEKWTFEIDAAFAAPPLLTPDVVYIGSLGNELFGLDRSTGRLLWETELKGRVKSAMATKENKLVVLTEPRFVYLFETVEGGPYAATP